MKTVVAFLTGVICVSAAIISGCETTRGFGEDIQNTGTNIQKGLSNVDPGEQAQDHKRWNQTDGSRMDAETHQDWANQTNVTNKTRQF